MTTLVVETVTMVRRFLFVVVIDVTSYCTSAIFQHSYTKLWNIDSHFSTTRTNQADHGLIFMDRL